MNRACAASLIVSSASGTAGAVLQPQLGQAGFHPLFGIPGCWQARSRARHQRPGSQSRLPGERINVQGIRAIETCRFRTRANRAFHMLECQCGERPGHPRGSAERTMSRPQLDKSPTPRRRGARSPAGTAGRLRRDCSPRDHCEELRKRSELRMSSANNPRSAGNSACPRRDTSLPTH